MKLTSIFLLVSLIAQPAWAITEAEKVRAATEVQRGINSSEIGPEIKPDGVKIDTTGLEWLQMSMGERKDSVILSMAVLEKNGIALGRSPLDYMDLIKEKLMRNHELYEQTITNVLAGIVYEKEPDSREILDALRRAKA